MTAAASISAREHKILSLILTAVAAEVETDVAHLTPEDTFIDLGLDSTGVAVVAGDISDGLGFEIPPDALFDYPSPASLARHLAGAPG